MTTTIQRWFSVTILCLVATAASAGEETLEFRLFTTRVSNDVLEAPVDGRTVSVGRWRGVAMFEDGRLAEKEFVDMVDNRGPEGSINGYSQYTFMNGDSLKLSFVAGWGADGFRGEYTVLSGTGAYQGATGSGEFTPAKESWENSNLLDVVIKVTTP